MKIGLVVTIVYVAVVGVSEFISGNASGLSQVGISVAAQELVASAMTKIAAGIATVALTVGLALPSLKGAAIVPKEEEKK